MLYFIRSSSPAVGVPGLARQVFGVPELVEGAVVGEGVVLSLRVGTGGPPHDGGWRSGEVAGVSRAGSVMTNADISRVSQSFLL